MKNVTSGTRNGKNAAGAIAGGPAALARVTVGRIVGRVVCPLPGLVGVGPGGPNEGSGVMHGTMIDGSGVGGPWPGSQGTTAVHTSVGANLPPQVRPNGTRKPSRK